MISKFLKTLIKNIMEQQVEKIENFSEREKISELLICKICNFIYIKSNSPGREGEKYRKCAWCINEGKTLRKYSLGMVKFIKSKISDKKYDYSLNNDSLIYYSTDILQIKCDKNHDVFKETIGRFLSRSKGNIIKGNGCLICFGNQPKIEIEQLRGNLPLIISESEKIHGVGTYLYDLIEPKKVQQKSDFFFIKCDRKNKDGIVCGNIFQTNISKFLGQGYGCSECFSNKPISYEMFLERFNKIYIDKFSTHRIKPEDITSSKSKPEVECLFCKFVINNTMVSAWLSGFLKLCDRCEGTEKWSSPGKLERECSLKAQEGIFSYELVDFNSVSNMSLHGVIPIICLICKENEMEKGGELIKENYVFEQKIYLHFHQGSGCLRCSGCLPWDMARLKRETEEKAKIGRYSYEEINFEDMNVSIRSTTKIPISCIPCKEEGYKGYVFNQSINKHFTMEENCPRCSGKLLWSYDRLLKEIDVSPFLKENFTYDLVLPEMVKNSSSIIPIGCKKCKTTFERNLCEHLIQLYGCKNCNKSYANFMAEEILRNLGIEFKSEHLCEGLDGHKYRYDIYFNYNGRIYILETDGEQHFKIIEFFHKKEGAFEKAQRRDIHKQYMALKNGFKIIRIDYKIKNSEMKEHIIKALNSSEEIYYSNPEIYTWLDEGVKTHDPNISNIDYFQYE